MFRGKFMFFSLLLSPTLFTGLLAAAAEPLVVEVVVVLPSWPPPQLQSCAELIQLRLSLASASALTAPPPSAAAAAAFLFAAGAAGRAADAGAKSSGAGAGAGRRCCASSSLSHSITACGARRREMNEQG